MREWCEEVGIERRFTSVGYPQANGQTEVTNRTIVAGLERKVGKARRGWVEELPGVLWAYLTTPRRATQETPFCLVYGSEAILPVETHVATIRMINYEETQNEKLREKGLHLLDAVRSNALFRTRAYQAKMAKAYN